MSCHMPCVSDSRLNLFMETTYLLIFIGSFGFAQAASVITLPSWRPSHNPDIHFIGFSF